MNNKRTIIFFFLLIGLVFVQKTLPKTILAFSPTQYDTPTQLTLTMYTLNQNGTILDNVKCIANDTRYGCTADSSKPYPFDTSSPTINIESDPINGTEQGYLYNVVTQELGP
jgi:hypothetical protein